MSVNINDTKEKLRIGTPSDEDSFYETEVVLKFIKPHLYEHSLTGNISPMRTDIGEPIIEGIKRHLLHYMRLRMRYQSNREKMIQITIKGFSLLFTKSGSKFTLNGKRMTRDAVLTALARVIYLSCFTDDHAKLFKKLNECMTIPDSVIHALENRVPYHWYENYSIRRARLNLVQTGDKKFALEISDNVWGEMSIQDVKSFLNFYRFNKRQSSWVNISPTKLWTRLMGEQPSESQLKLMINFLKQNRTEKIVEERAKELLEGFIKTYDQVKMVDNRMFVRGKMADWVLEDRNSTSRKQRVSTFIIDKIADDDDPDADHIIQKEYKLVGPICIDNMQSDSSTGDQMVTRAISLMNDAIITNRIYTLNRYITDEHREGGIRLDWNAL